MSDKFLAIKLGYHTFGHRHLWRLLSTPPWIEYLWPEDCGVGSVSGKE